MEQVKPDEMIAIDLQAQQWNTILGGLSELPWKFAAPIIDAIQNQCAARATPDYGVDDQPDVIHMHKATN